MANTDAQLAIGADVSALEAGMDKAAQAVKESMARMEASLAGVSGAFQKLQGVFLAFTAAVAGGVAFKAVIQSSSEWALESGKLAKSLGITVEQASVMQVALARTGISSETLVSASQKLSKQIFSNGAAFETMGIKVRDSSGQYRPVMDVMTEANSKLKDIKNPIEQNIAGMQLYGKAWGEVRQLLKLTTEQMAESEKRAKELHLIAGTEDVAKAKQYEEQMRDLNLVGKSLEIQFGNALIPVFARLGQWMSQEAPAAGDAFATVLESVGAIAGSTWLIIKDMGSALGATAAQAAALLRGDLAGIKAIGEARDAEEKKNAAALATLWANFGKPLPPSQSPAAHDNNGPTHNFAKDKETLVRTWAAALEEIKLKQGEMALAEGRFYEMSKAEEQAYWQSKLALTEAGSKDQIAVRQKIATLGNGILQDQFQREIAGYKLGEEAAGHNLQAKLAYAQAEVALTAQKYGAQSKQAQEARASEVKIEQELAAQKRAVADELENRARTARQMDIDGAEQDARFEEQLGNITKLQLLEQERTFAAQRFAIDQQALEQKLALLKNDPTADPVELEKLESKLLEIKRKYSLQATQLAQQSALEAMRPQMAVFQTMENSFASAATGMLTRAQTLRQGMTSVFGSISKVLVDEMVTKPLAAEAMKYLRQTAMAKAFSAFKLSDIFATSTAEAGAAAVAVTSDATQAASATTAAATIIPAKAGGAAAGAAEAVADIPIAGPALAAAAFAATMAMVMGALKGGKSAAGGYDIPAGINPVTQLHAEEMVLPSKYANAIRRMAEGGAGGGEVHHHYETNNINAIDPATFQKWFEKNSYAAAPGLRRLARNFTPTGR